MTNFSKEYLKSLLHEHVKDEYQQYHAEMVATVMKGYAKELGEDEALWYATGLLHDIDFQMHPDTHPKESLNWFRDWGLPEELHHAVEAHAYGYNGFTTMPQTKLAAALMACDELCGLFYAYRKLNPIPYGEIKASSIKKRFNEKTFAAKIDREVITRGITAFEISLDDHIVNMIRYLKELN